MLKQGVILYFGLSGLSLCFFLVGYNGVSGPCDSLAMSVNPQRITITQLPLLGKQNRGKRWRGDDDLDPAHGYPLAYLRCQAVQHGEVSMLIHSMLCENQGFRFIDMHMKYGISLSSSPSETQGPPETNPHPTFPFHSISLSLNFRFAQQIHKHVPADPNKTLKPCEKVEGEKKHSSVMYPISSHSKIYQQQTPG